MLRARLSLTGRPGLTAIAAATVLMSALVATVATPADAAGCRRFALTDAGSGETVHGIEDLAWHRQSERLILSAMGDPDAPDSPRGIYGLSFKRMKREFIEPSREPALPVPRLTELFQDETPLAPHGIAIWDPSIPTGFLDRRVSLANARLMVINHRERNTETLDDGSPATTVEVFEIAPNGELDHVATYGDNSLCPANDLTALDGERALITLDRRHCGGLASAWEMATDRSGGRVVAVDLVSGLPPETLLENLDFPNGIAVTEFAQDEPQYMYIAETRARRIRRFAFADGRITDSGTELPVPGGPDNLSIDSAGHVVTALHPDLFRLFLVKQGLSLKGRAPSRLVAVDGPVEGAKARACNVMHDDPDGDGFSGATAALRIGGLLIAGSAHDDGLLVCTDPGTEAPACE